LAALERLLDAQREDLSAQRTLARQQQEQLAAQQGEIERLRAGRAAPAPASPLILPAKFRGRGAVADEAASARAGGRHTSRRGLLKLGGVAAAAGLAAGAGELLRPGTAHAAPVPTGGFLVLGGENDANTNTGLAPTPGTDRSTLDSLLVVDASSVATANAVVAFSSGAQAVNGNDNAGGIGVSGTGFSGFGVYATSVSNIDLVANGTGRLFLRPQSFTGAPTSGTNFQAGELIRDHVGDLWICVAGGGAGQWRKVDAPQVGYAGGSVNLLAVAIRLLDTRGGSPVPSHGTAQFHAGGVGAIPAGATAVFGHLAAALRPGVNPGDGSSAILWPAGQTRPGAVNIVYNGGDLQGEYTGTLALVAIGAGGQINLYSQPILPVGVDYLFDAFGFVM
jgi:hypothetical protein